MAESYVPTLAGVKLAAAAATACARCDAVAHGRFCSTLIAMPRPALAATPPLADVLQNAGSREPSLLGSPSPLYFFDVGALRKCARRWHPSARARGWRSVCPLLVA